MWQFSKLITIILRLFVGSTVRITTGGGLLIISRDTLDFRDKSNHPTARVIEFLLVDSSRMQHCPKCGSSRVRRGYDHESVFLRLICRRELLCNHCNLRFTRFVLPGMMPKSNHRNRTHHPEETKTQPMPVDEPKAADSNGHGVPHKRHRNRHAHSKQCPRCNSPNVQRSSRRGFREHTKATLLSVYPYRCHNCDMRFFAKRSH